MKNFILSNTYSAVITDYPHAVHLYPYVAEDVKNEIDEEYDLYSEEELAKHVVDEINFHNREITNLYKTLARLGFEIKNE